MKRNAIALVLCLALVTFLSTLPAVPVVAQEAAAPAQVTGPTERTVLPIPEPRYPHSTVLDARNATPPPRFEVKAPAGAPNVLIVLIDDMGFGQSGSFGGPIRMPTVDRLANARIAVQQFPHHGALLAHAGRAAQRAQPSHEQYGLDHGDCDGLPGQYRAASR